MKDLNSVQQFYKDKTIFITGGNKIKNLKARDQFIFKFSHSVRLDGKSSCGKITLLVLEY